MSQPKKVALSYFAGQKGGILIHLGINQLFKNMFVQYLSLCTCYFLIEWRHLQVHAIIRYKVMAVFMTIKSRFFYTQNYQCMDFDNFDELEEYSYDPDIDY